MVVLSADLGMNWGIGYMNGGCLHCLSIMGVGFMAIIAAATSIGTWAMITPFDPAWSV